MQKIKAILFLIIMGITIFPWRLICIAHPTGHSHHQHDPNKPSPCELHRLASLQGGTHFLPPMHCGTISADTDNYTSVIQDFHFQKNIDFIVPIEYSLELKSETKENQTFLLPPEPNCRSAPLIADNPLRGPPSC